MISDSACGALVWKPDAKESFCRLTIPTIAPTSTLRFRRRRTTFYAWLLLNLAPLMPVCAAVTLPSIFSDGMVLQRDMPVPIWGKAEPGESVSVEFARQIQTCTADSAGHWSMKLDALPVSTRPRELKIGSHIIKDVLVGDVWLCSGQSNMEMPVGDLGDAAYNGGGAYRGVENWRQETALPDCAELRLFRDDKQPAWKARGWRHCQGEDLSSFSATAYFFGKILQSKLGAPVGLIDVSRGGSSIQSWTPKNYALLNPVTRYYANVFQQHRDQINAFNQANERARLARETGEKNTIFPPPLPPELALANRFGGVASLFDHFIEPLAPFAVRGVVWYQGESNGDFSETARVYDSMLRDLIDGWRARWGKPQMPWFLVQLPNWNSSYSVHWPWVRQGQLAASQNISHVGMVTTCDIGDSSDLHPPQKREVGERLAKLVLEQTYGKKLIASGPTIQSVHRLDAKLRVEFATGGAPIHLKGSTWNNLEMAGEDCVFHPATATFTNAVAMVSSAVVQYPCALRYGWTNEFRPSLFNAAGWPASPFALVVEPGDAFRLLSQANSLFNVGDRWCAIGDSITHGGGYLKTIYLYCATRFPNHRFDLFNCGCGGDTAAGTLRRMDPDIFVHAPTLSTVMLGINDVWWEHSSLIGSNDYIHDLGRIVDRLQSANSDVILVTPSPYDATAHSPEPLDPKRADLERYVNQLRVLATERAIPVVDLFQVMSDITSREQAKDPTFTLLAPDRIHPNATGNFVIADSFLKMLRAPQYVSRLVLDAANLKPLLVENATLDKLSGGDDWISFNLLENALPFPSSEIPEASLPLVDFSQDFNREILQVIGLKDGQYELSIDNAHVGDYSSASLREGINVALVADTPQNRQATRVAALNNQRTQIISEKLRYLAMMEFGGFRTNYAIDDIATPRRDLELILNGNKGAKKTAETVNTFEKYFTLKSQQSKFLQQAQDYDDLIWQGNQPLRQHWQLIFKK